MSLNALGKSLQGHLQLTVETQLQTFNKKIFFPKIIFQINGHRYFRTICRTILEKNKNFINLVKLIFCTFDILNLLHLRRKHSMNKITDGVW